MTSRRIECAAGIAITRWRLCPLVLAGNWHSLEPSRVPLSTRCPNRVTKECPDRMTEQCPNRMTKQRTEEQRQEQEKHRGRTSVGMFESSPSRLSLGRQVRRCSAVRMFD
jgi:hypothetical protein